MSKKTQVIELLATGKSSFQIAEIVGCHDGYVRAVKRRQIKPETHKAESRKHLAKYRARHRERVNANERARYHARKAAMEMRS